MKVTKHLRVLLPCLVWAAVGMFACQLAVGDADLTAVKCEQDGQKGPPACAQNQICVAGQCTQCLTGEVCTNGVDDDCNDKIDDGCGAAGKDGGGGGKDTGVENPDVSTGGAAGATGQGGSTANGGSSTGGAAGEAGASTGGSAGSPTGGSAGSPTGGSAGSPTGGSAGAAGSSGTGGAVSTGGSAGTGGQPACKAINTDCDNAKPWECCTLYCCLTVKYGKCGKAPNANCNSGSECCLGICQSDHTCM